jgi:predicted nucleotidyltransferase
MIIPSPILYDRLQLTPRQLETLCQNAKIETLAVFGSILRDDFTPQSDIDLLITYHPDAKRSLFRKLDLKETFEIACQRPVDLVSRTAIEHSPNPIRRNNILSTATLIYDARPRSTH